MRFAEGSLILGYLKGAPVRLHWSIPLGGLIFGGFTLTPGFWLGFALLLTTHQLGHVLAVAFFRQQLSDIVFTGVGGHCRYLGRPSPTQQASIAWAGLVPHLVLLAVGLFLWHPQPGTLSAEIHAALVVPNSIIFLWNLIPLGTLDGAKACPPLMDLIGFTEEKRNAVGFRFQMAVLRKVGWPWRENWHQYQQPEPLIDKQVSPGVVSLLDDILAEARLADEEEQRRMLDPPT